jgi:hypothetical protein
MLGVPEDQIPSEAWQLINALDFSYSILDAAARDDMVLAILKKLHSTTPVSGKDRIGAWEERWSENLRAFAESGYAVEQLLPYYYRRGKAVMRLFGQYVLPTDPWFESNVLAVLRMWIAGTFLRQVEHVYEFGCGPAHNLAAIAELYPAKMYHGLDWAPASQHIIQALANTRGVRIDGARFDMFCPDEGYRIEANSAVLTFGAMEQLGTDYEAFLEFLLRARPRICIHVEPIYELYDRGRLFDYLAARWSEKRGYLRGYLTRLKEMNGSILQIQKVQRNIGSLYHDGWTTVVWNPRGTED